MIILSGTATATTFTGPEAEFDARNLTGSDDSEITLWEDSSGNNRDAAEGAVNGPILKTGILNGNSIARWDATVRGLDFSNATNPTSFTIIAVVKCTDSVLRTILSESTNGSNAPVFGIDNNKMRLHELDIGDVGISSTTMNTTSFYTVAVTYDDAGTAYAFYLNGSADGSGSYNANWSRPFNRIGLRGGNQSTFKGDIAYVAFWHSVLSSGELTTRFDDLRTVWAHY